VSSVDDVLLNAAGAVPAALASRPWWRTQPESTLGRQDATPRTLLATIGHDDTLRFHSLERIDAARSGRLAAVPRIALPDVRGSVSHLALTATDSGLLAVVATSAGTVQIWDARSGRQVSRVELDGIGTISALAARHGMVFGGTLTGRTFSFTIDDPVPAVHPTHETTAPQRRSAGSATGSSSSAAASPARSSSAHRPERRWRRSRWTRP
jgi:hypothetical protein